MYSTSLFKATIYLNSFQSSCTSSAEAVYFYVTSKWTFLQAQRQAKLRRPVNSREAPRRFPATDILFDEALI